MHFCHKMATEEASEHSKYDSLLTQKNGQKICCPKMVEFGSVEISEPPKSTILGVGWVIYFQPTPKGFQSTRKKFFMLTEPFRDSVGPPESKTAKIRPRYTILQKLHPKIDLFGVWWSKIIRPAPKRSQSPQKLFWSYLTHCRVSRLENC